LLVTEINLSVSIGFISIAVLLGIAVLISIWYAFRYRELKHKLKNNEENLTIATLAFQTNEAIMVTDENNTIIRINPAFTQMMGHTAADILGKKSDTLKSEKNDSKYYEKIRETVNSEGKWSGEIWNQQKNGESFPTKQSISTVYDDKKNITHYISFFTDITEYKLAKKEIEKLAFSDALTGLANRRLLYEMLEHDLNVAERYNRAGILFLLDLDHFKHINDSLGHSTGDLILVEVAQRLESLLRNTDKAVRLGGDEFVILTSPQEGVHADLLEQSQVIAKKIINKISQPFLVNEHELFITTSIGITLFTGIDESVEILLKRADTAMYQAKDAGRNTFQFYQQSMQEAADTRLHLERHLRNAIANNELSLHYQPQLSASNEIVGAEALLRWHNEELGHVSPVDFIPIAEETGMIVPIGQWVILAVCEQIKVWEKQGIEIPHIAINISAKQFHQNDFVSNLIYMVYEHNLLPNQILLEITEGVFLGNLEEAIDKMNALKENGFSFSIDDFGTGYSSLTYLKRLPFDQLKIDQSFVRGLIDNQADAAIVKAIVVMAKSMGLNLIAEGVETDKHLACLSGYGCHYYQGYYFSKPLTAEKLVEYIKSHSKTEQKGGF